MSKNAYLKNKCNPKKIGVNLILLIFHENTPARGDSEGGVNKHNFEIFIYYMLLLSFMNILSPHLVKSIDN